MQLSIGVSSRKIIHQVHHPMEHIQGFIGSHWVQPLDEYLPRITQADAMAIDFGLKK